MMKKNDLQPKKELTAVCGLFCPSCTVYIGTAEDPERLKKIAKLYGTEPEVWQCRGCRSDKRSYFCENQCKMVACAAEKGIDFCGECGEYPCDELKTFQKARPHRLELWEAQKRIKDIGYERWFDEMLDHFACPSCQTINSAYDRKCRACGAEPSCAYVERHGKKIAAQAT